MEMVESTSIEENGTKCKDESTKSVL